ncbi:hypothetical protein TNCV_195801 [Trichonephila clavipes]|uniref:Uncharacterized protein n=1 Tax=Trichonephila clavipes TaxID=2585209 RepID=A0A8X7BM65_TRICX|nr:hypothetical protein TNCV_195801 [Trichonephila clavipes]
MEALLECYSSSRKPSSLQSAGIFVELHLFQFSEHVSEVILSTTASILCFKSGLSAVVTEERTPNPYRTLTDKNHMVSDRVNETSFIVRPFATNPLVRNSDVQPIAY